MGKRLTVRTRIWVWGAGLLLVFLLGGAAASEKPWSLRPLIRIPSNVLPSSVFEYDEESAEWRVQVGETLPVRRMGFSVTLADGTTLRAADLGVGKAKRASFPAGLLGPGAAYSVHFPAKKGLAVHHEVTQFTKQPFVFIMVGVTNVGSSPVAVRTIRPVVAGSGDVAGWRPQSRVLTRHMSMNCGYLLFGEEQPVALAMLHDPVGQFALGLGTLPQGRAVTTCSFEFMPTGCQGEIACGYDPPLMLAPGQTLESDVVWFSYGITDPAKIEPYYCWTLGNQPKPLLPTGPPRVWTGAETGTPLAVLAERAAAWRSAGVAYVLIPDGWASAPGSLRGASPNYPEDMSEAVDKLLKAGVYPGIAVDPLAKSLNDAKKAKGSGKKGGGKKKDAQDDEDTSPGASGAAGWVDPRSEDALKTVAERIHPILEWRVSFLIATPSAIPDETLARLGLSRREANQRGLELVAKAAGDIPVLPAPTVLWSAEQGRWLEAARVGNEMTEYALLSAPVRVDANTVSDLSAETGAAMRLWPGSVELLGNPKGSAGRLLGESLGRSWLTARPLKNAGGAPLLWQVDFRDTDGRYLRGLVIAFPGAGAWTLNDLTLDAGVSVFAWDPANGKALDSNAGPVPAAQALRVHGLALEQSRPAFMGASGGLDLHMDALENVVWDEGKGVLRGELHPPLREAGTAYFAIPSSWTYSSGNVNGQKLKVKKTKDLLVLPVPEDGFRFELEFKKK